MGETARGDERQRQRQRQRQMDARARRHMQVNEHEVPTLWVATGIPIPMLRPSMLDLTSDEIACCLHHSPMHTSPCHKCHHCA